ncbi:uncharacterized protein [Ptychodera flava]|uniref:uncharacterized protein n=1 Tax=Ptychodera flava TaxID=63121 RepID=UPI00396A4314
MANNDVVSGGTPNEMTIGALRFGRDCRGGPGSYVRRYPAIVVIVGFVFFVIGAVVMITTSNYILLITGAIITFSGGCVYRAQLQQMRGLSRARGRGVLDLLEAANNDGDPCRMNYPEASSNTLVGGTGTTVYLGPESSHQTSDLPPNYDEATRSPATHTNSSDISSEAPNQHNPYPNQESTGDSHNFSNSSAGPSDEPSEPPPSYESVVERRS